MPLSAGWIQADLLSCLRLFETLFLLYMPLSKEALDHHGHIRAYSSPECVCMDSPSITQRSSLYLLVVLGVRQQQIHDVHAPYSVPPADSSSVPNNLSIKCRPIMLALTAHKGLQSGPYPTTGSADSSLDAVLHGRSTGSSIHICHSACLALIRWPILSRPLIAVEPGTMAFGYAGLSPPSWIFTPPSAIFLPFL